MLSLLRLACLAFTLLAQTGASWLVYEKHAVAVPAFGALGLEIMDADPENWQVGGDTSAGQVYFSRVDAVNGRDVAGERPAQVARQLTGSADITLKLRGLDDSGRPSVREVALKPSAALRAASEAREGSRFALASQAIDLVVAVLLIGAAGLLRLRRFSHPVAILFSFAFLLLAAVGTFGWWARLELYWVDWAIEAAWIALFLIAIPALPTGRFVPSWTRWAMIAGPIGALVLTNNALKGQWGDPVRIGLLLLALLCVFVRFGHTPRGVERQQLKWASLGLSAGLLMYASAFVIDMLLLWFDVPVGTPLSNSAEYGRYALTRLSFLVMAAGVLVCLLDWRLNDADAAVGRSTGYAAITIAVAVVWAVAGKWINTGIVFVTGGSDPSLSTALSTIVALAVLAPAQARVMGWTEAKFQRALVRLRGLPARLAKWQHGDDPEPVAQAALGVIVDGVGAVHAALVVPAPSGLRILATHGVDPAELADGLSREADGDDPSGPPFPLKLALTDGDTLVGRLLLGPRSDGARYTREERAAVAAILDPLSDAIRLTARRAERNVEVEARLARVEAAAAGRLQAAE